MRRTHALLCCLAVLAGCAGGSLNATTAAVSPLAPDSAFSCVQSQLNALKYRRTQYDQDDRWIRAQKVDSSGAVSSGLFRRTLDKMEIRVHPDASGNSGMEFILSTINEFSTAAGTTSEEQRASASVQRDAATIAQACSRQ